MRRVLLVSCMGAVLAAVSAAALDPSVPYLSGRVNDYAGMLDAGSMAGLEAKLKDYETRTGRQFAVLTIPSLADEPLDEYSLKVARTWKLGRAGQDDGLLLLVARDDRKVRIEVGYGLEGALPDALCGRIVRDEIVPRFRGGDFAGGVTAGVDAILAALSGSPSSAPTPGMPAWREFSSFDFATIALCALLALFLALYGLHFLFATAPGTARRDDAWLRLLMTGFPISVYVGLHFGKALGAMIFAGIVAAFKAADWSMTHTAWGQGLLRMTRRKGPLRALFEARGEKPSERWWNLGSGGGFGGGSSGGGYSGGGGSFGGGGASGSW